MVTDLFVKQQPTVRTSQGDPGKEKSLGSRESPLLFTTTSPKADIVNLASFRRKVRQLLRAELPSTGSFVPYTRRFNILGTEFDFWIVDQTGQQWYDRDNWKDAVEFQMLDRMIRSDSRVLELGLHHGFTAAFISKKVCENGRYVGVELLPIASVYAMANLKLNAINERGRIVNAAGGARSGTVTFANERDANGHVTTDGHGVQIKQITGDSLLPELGGRIDCLKIDVEGFEVGVLEGCQEILAQLPNIALEIHLEAIGNYGCTVARIFQLINLDKYDGHYFWNPRTGYRDPTSHRVASFDREQLPLTGIMNLFLLAKTSVHSASIGDVR